MSRHPPTPSGHEKSVLRPEGEETTRDMGQGVVTVIDWTKKKRKPDGPWDGGMEGEEIMAIMHEKAQKFNDMVKLEEYLDKVRMLLCLRTDNYLNHC